MTLALIQHSLLFAALAVAAVTDVRSQKVYNWLTFPAVAVALSLAALGGWGSLAAALQGFGAGLLLGLAAMVFCRMGGGDAKLLIVMGTFTGAAFLAHAALWAALCGGPMALWAMWRRGVFRYTLQNMAANTLMKASGAANVALTDNAKAGKLPYAVPIALGAVLAALTRGF